MSDSEKSSHWGSLISDLGVEPAPRPAKPAPVVPPPAPKKRPAATPAETRPKSNWDEVASNLGVDVPPRPPKPAPSIAAKPVKPAPAPVAAKHEEPAGDQNLEAAPRPARHDGDSHRRSRGGDRQERRGRRDRATEGRGGRQERGRHERHGDRSGGRGEHERIAEPPAEELLADEMVSADFVDDLVAAEEEIDWGDEPSNRAPTRDADDESRPGRRRRRRRGGRRRREGAERPPRGESREFDEEADEREHIDEIVDAIEASPIAEPDEREPLEEAVAAEGLDEKRGRRRRRRRGRRRESEGGAAESSRRNAADDSDSDLEDLEEALSDDRGPAAFGSLRHEREATNGDLDAEHDDDDDDHELRPSHRAIPSWDEAIGVIVSANMEARAKNPHSGGGQRGRGRGHRGQGRRS